MGNKVHKERIRKKRIKHECLLSSAKIKQYNGEKFKKVKLSNENCILIRGLLLLILQQYSNQLKLKIQRLIIW